VVGDERYLEEDQIEDMGRGDESMAIRARARTNDVTWAHAAPNLPFFSVSVERWRLQPSL